MRKAREAIELDERQVPLLVEREDAMLHPAPLFGGEPVHHTAYDGLIIPVLRRNQYLGDLLDRKLETKANHPRTIHLFLNEPHDLALPLVKLNSDLLEETVEAKANPCCGKAQLLSLVIGLSSAYATGAIKGAQLYAFFKIFPIIPLGQVSQPVRLFVFPLIPFMNVFALHCVENRKAFNQAASPWDLFRLGWKSFKQQPMAGMMILLAAIAQGMMTTTSLLSLLEGEKASHPSLMHWLTAASLGVVNVVQYILLEGVALSDRMDKGCIYESPEYSAYLKLNSNIDTRYLTYFFVHSIPIAGAFLYTALAFIQSRQLIERLMGGVEPSSPHDYREDIGNMVGLSLGLISGGLQYSLYGFRTQKAVADKLAPPERKHSGPPHSCICNPSLKLVFAMVFSLAEAMTVVAAAAALYKGFSGEFPNRRILIPMACFSGLVGFIQNLCADGEALEEKKSSALVERGGGKYQLPEFLRGVMRIVVFTSARAGIQVAFIPHAKAEDINWEITAAAYSVSSLAALLAVGLSELPRILGWSSVTQREQHSSASERRESRSMAEIQEEVIKNQVEAETQNQFYRSPKRLGIQGFMQLVIPVVLGVFLEKGLRWLFTNHSHLGDEESLDHAKNLGSLFTAILAEGLHYMVDCCLGCPDRRLLQRLDPGEDKAVEGENTEQKGQNLQAMAQGLEGYSFKAFRKLIGDLDSKAQGRIIGILKICRQNQLTEEKNNGLRLSIQPKYSLYVKQLQGEYIEEVFSEILSKLKGKFRNWEGRNKFLLLPYYFEIKAEYGFFYFTQEKRRNTAIITVTCYSPTNNQIPYDLLKQWNALKVDPSTSKRTEGLIEKLSVLTARKDGILRQIAEDKQNSRLDSELERMFTQISKVEGELERIKNQQLDVKEQKENQKWAALALEDRWLTLNWQPELEISYRPRRDSAPWVVMQMKAILEGRIDLNKNPYALLPNDNLDAARLSQAAFFQRTSSNNENRRNERSCACPCVLL